MAGKKVTEMTYMSGSNSDITLDWIPYVDVSDTSDPNKKINLYELSNALKLTQNTTVNLNSSMTTAQLQATIDSVPKNLGGKTLTFQFADGTYTLTAGLVFSGFFSGQIVILGNTSEATTAHTTQAVILDGSSLSAIPLTIQFCAAYALVKWIAIKHLNTQQGIYFNRVCNMYLLYSYTLGIGTKTAGVGGVLCTGCLGTVEQHSFSNAGNGLYVAGVSTILSTANTSTGTAPNYGINVVQGATIAKDGAQPTGTTANEAFSAGGVIR